jgi:uncharacterized membrane protein YhaH (DUF805 family)
MASANPYQAPGAAVADTGNRTQEVQIFSSAGRIGRARYIAYSILFYVLFVIVAAIGGAIGTVGMILMIAGLVAWIVMSFMLTIQRCHDFNASGWLALVVLIPLVNLIFIIIPGTDGENNYGPPTPPNSVGVLIAAWLLPVIFVIGIVAAVALPAYQDYQKRAQSMQKK